MKGRVSSFALSALAIAIAGLSVACSGNGTGGGKVTPANPVPQSTAGRGKIRFTITVPKKPARSAGRRPLYISASTQSLTIAVAGASPMAYNLTPGTAGCSSATGNIVLTCSIEQATPTGTQAIAIATYDQPNGAGNVLSQNTVSANVLPGQLNTIPIVLNGVIASFALALAAAQLQGGVPGSDALSLNAYDADQNLIVGPGAYAPGIVIADSDASGGTTLSVTQNGASTTGVTSATITDPAAAIAVTYNGQPLSGSTFTATSGSLQTAAALSFAGAITHVVIVIQENRTVDNLFNGFPGANTVQSGVNLQGQSVALQPVNLSEPYDLGHFHADFLNAYNGGAMNGFDRESVACPACSAPPEPAYAYVPQSQAQPYWSMAQTFAFADEMFQTNEGPSFPAHMYLVSGTSAMDSSNIFYGMDNPSSPSNVAVAGCDAPAGSLVSLINPATGALGPKVFPCFDHTTLFDSLDAAKVSWRYYQSSVGNGLWFAPDDFNHIRNGPDYANVSSPQTKFFSDVTAGKLAAVSWIVPTAAESDHPQSTDGSGPAWVASVVNAVGNSAYWSNTAIFVVWDDWGGWYDHVAPPQYNYYELGFRVPLIAISPYAKAGYVSHTVHEFGSLLKFTEQTFGLATLGYTDTRADNLSDMFDFTQPALPFTTIPAAKVPLKDARDTRAPDND
jgi:phospholipase C